MDEESEEKKILEARREARRKRILENAEKRLKLITGNASSEAIIENKDDVTENIVLPEEIHENEPCLVVDEVEIEEPVVRIHETRKIEAKTLQETSITSIFEHFNVLIVLVAFLTRLLINSGINYYLNEAILMPFLLLEVTALVFHKRSNTNSLLNTLLLLTNLPRRQVKSIMYAVRLSEVMVKDFCVFFFSFLVCHVFTEMIF